MKKRIIPSPPAGFFLKNFGCKLNQSEGEELEKRLIVAGYRRLDSMDKADIIIINGCSVTAKAHGKARRALNFAGKKSRAFTILCGCFGDRNPTASADIVFSNAWQINIFQEGELFYIGEVPDKKAQSNEIFIDIIDYRPRCRAFLKVQDGCDGNCSYCIVRLIRNKLWAMPLDEAQSRLVALVKQGYKEVVLLGANLTLLNTNWSSSDEKGKSAKDISLIDYIRLASSYFPRLRLGSLEPSIIVEIAEEMAINPALCPHLHISLQSGSDKILALMQRKYNISQFLERVDKARQLLPELELSTDIITGFPGESDEDFKKTLEIIQYCQFFKVHVFPFSPRPGTIAEKMGGYFPEKAKERAKIAIDFAEEIGNKRKKKRINSHAEVLFEEKVQGHFEGFTENYMRFRLEKDHEKQNCLILEKGDENHLHKRVKKAEKMHFFGKEGLEGGALLMGEKDLSGKIFKVLIKDIKNGVFTGKLLNEIG